jgi:hypothetical protein
MRFPLAIERHRLGPRVFVLGRRVHEYQVGLAALAACPLVSVAGWAPFLPWTALGALAGLWLVVKDWPDLFPSTRDRASWRLGLHRLPRRTEPSQALRREGGRARSVLPSAEKSVA